MKKILRIISSIFKTDKPNATSGISPAEDLKIEIPLNENWIDYKNNSTIGKTGSESGTTIFDCESNDGARITLESNCGNIPFAVTFGIYGLMFHTEYFSHLTQSIEYIRQRQDIIDKIFVLYDIPEEDRTDGWYQEHEDLLNDLIQI